MLRLADYSRVWLAALRNETRSKYDERMQGTLQFVRTQAQLEASGKDVKARLPPTAFRTRFSIAMAAFAPNRHSLMCVTRSSAAC